MSLCIFLILCLFILCDCILDLKKAAWELSALIAVLMRHGLRVDAGVQADIDNWDCSCATYAKVVKLTPPVQNVTKLASGQSVGAENISVEPSDSKYTGQKRGKNGNGTGMENVTSKSTCHQQLKTSTKITSMEKRRNMEQKRNGDNWICLLRLSHMMLY